MEYKALYRKYRPKTFDDVIGQEHIILSLKNILKTNKISHAYLFSGPKGTGKTSIAKIFAMMLNCVHKDPADVLNPCEICLSNLNNNIDIIEMDAASNNGVDEIRDLKEKIEQTPMNGKYKIYIIDEVHMLTKSAFNALLKTLEEPPKHAIFILATTDLHKIPLTIRSRVQNFVFHRMNDENIIKQLSKVFNQEHIKYDTQALKLIARLSSGGMRDALTIADQVSMLHSGIISAESIYQNFGVLSSEQIVKIFQLISINNGTKLISLLNEFQNNGVEPQQFVLSLVNFLKEKIILSKTNNVSLLSWFEPEELSSVHLDNKTCFELTDIFYDMLIKVNKSEYPFEIIQLGVLKALNAINPSLQEDSDETYVAPVFIKPVFNKENHKTSTNNVFTETKEIIEEELTSNEPQTNISMEVDKNENTILQDIKVEKIEDDGFIDNSFLSEKIEEEKVEEDKFVLTTENIFSVISGNFDIEINQVNQESLQTQTEEIKKETEEEVKQETKQSDNHFADALIIPEIEPVGNGLADEFTPYQQENVPTEVQEEKNILLESLEINKAFTKEISDQVNKTNEFIIQKHELSSDFDDVNDDIIQLQSDTSTNKILINTREVEVPKFDETMEFIEEVQKEIQEEIKEEEKLPEPEEISTNDEPIQISEPQEVNVFEYIYNTLWSKEDPSRDKAAQFQRSINQDLAIITQNKPEFSEIAELFEDSLIMAASEYFINIYNKDTAKVNKLKELANTPKMQEFVKYVFDNKNKYIYPVDSAALAKIRETIGQNKDIQIADYKPKKWEDEFAQNTLTDLTQIGKLLLGDDEELEIEYE
ncbi:DNA polymerase III subunit gamma/tau [Mycoplasma sp. 1232]|uniref:DNA polymerase III subunit gamma/tau n=1 Tax=Mycoplasma sp. 1232 TaxID=3108527 RepID=UPI002B25F394|nr:DNA polymerase III subunit gamma/tau [Mycoplasma sp. 1232]MEA4333890.1 DNA polymerase III subunit gamma/tau [Mycoplasma sp. 1232]